MTGNEREVHESRLKFYRDFTLNVTEELRQHVGNQGLVLDVAAVREHRFPPGKPKQPEFLIAWRGLEDAQASWEPWSTMPVDIPLLLKAYARTTREKSLQALVDSL